MPEIIRSCPCCDGAAQCHGEERPDLPLRGAYVRCTACNLSTDIFDSRAEALAAWNRRPGDVVDLPAAPALTVAPASEAEPRALLAPREALEAITPMLLANAAYCIEPGTDSPATDAMPSEIVWKLLSAAQAIQSQCKTVPALPTATRLH